MNGHLEISAVTLPTANMAVSVDFYESLGLERHRGGPDASFSTFSVGRHHINLRLFPTSERPLVDTGVLVIFRIENVDRYHQQIIDKNLLPDFSPRDADWGERYFHIRDPDGNRLSFAQVIDKTSPT